MKMYPELWVNKVIKYILTTACQYLAKSISPNSHKVANVSLKSV